MRRQLVTLLVCTATAACSGDDPPTAPDDMLAPPPEGQGVQYSMKTTIPAGAEAEHCKFVRAPADGLWVNRDEVRFTPGSHHFLLYETAYDEIPTEKEDGTAVDTSGVFDCSDGATNGWAVSRLVGGSQNGDGASALLFPDDVAVRVRQNAVLLMNAHYINTKPEPIEPEIRINLWTIPEEQVAIEGDILFWYNIFIEVPGMSESTARMRCTIPEDITLTTAQSHMHRRGVSYGATFVDGDMPFYQNDHWEDVPVALYPDGFDIPGDTEIEYWCDYENGEARDVHQGPRSTDEMCMLIGGYYPRVEGLGLCAAEPARAFETNALGGRWIGQGEASCAETLDCALSFEGDFFTNLQGCVNRADPAVFREVSDAVRCFLLSFNDGADPFESCTAELDVCRAH